MPLTIGTPCGEDWDAMEVRGRGRHCERCDHIVVDLSRMTRERAEAFVRERRGHRICGRLMVDPATGVPQFPPAEAGPARFRGGLVLAAALGGAGCATAEPAPPVEVAEEPTPASRMEPMQPAALASVPRTPTTGPVPAAELNAPGVVDPTEEQRRLTESKRARRHPPPPPPYGGWAPLLGDVVLVP